MAINDTFEQTLIRYRDRVEKTLTITLSNANTAPSLLRESLIYTTLNGGKRLRPTLLYATGDMFGAPTEALDYLAAAIECIHCYSLVHDDLPAMDDDKLRRKKPTCHIMFGEALAILTGDALQALAFELLANAPNITPPAKIEILRLISHHVGAQGMVGGQVLDIISENKMLSVSEIEQMHCLKTGALIRSSILMGALAADQQDPKLLLTLDQFATQLGIAFQLQDDLLDVIGQEKNLGKSTGKDHQQKKSSYTQLLGVEATKEHVLKTTQAAKNLLRSLPKSSDFLLWLCDKLIHRVN